MKEIELTVLVNKVNAGKVEEIGRANGGRLEDRTEAPALSETRKPADQRAENIIDHDILRFTFDTTTNASEFVERAAALIGVTPDIFKSTLTAKRDGVKFDLLIGSKDQAGIKSR